MNVLIVFSHPETESSFNAAMLQRSVETLEAQGHEVKVSNLYKMNFNPVASGDDFIERRFPDQLQYDREQKFAAQNGFFAPDIAEELEKVQWCDMLILHFPLYWFSMPAIMKGWIDRVFVNSVIYGAGKRYETAGLAGKKAMVVTSCGGYESMFEPDGLLGDIKVALWHIHNGMLHYTGCQVLEPFVAYSPVFYGPEKAGQYLDEYAERLKGLETDEPMKFHYTHEFDENFKLKADIEPRSVGHKREK